LNKVNKLTLTGPRQSASFDPLEPSIAQIQGVDANYKSSFSSYNDAAIVVVGRPSGESTDYLPGGVAAGTGATQPLELTTNERDMIKLATDNFTKVIVLVNTTSTMEIDELQENSKIDAIVWVGMCGNYGTLGIADILCGKVNPSGALPDLYAAKNMSSPAMQNMGKFTYSNSELITRGVTSANYVMEAEGIYVGYHYYETRYNDSILGLGNANSTAGAVASTGNWKYSDEVTYGFGYGLSYSSFTQEFVGNPVINVSAHSITMDYKVKVTNNATGVKGKSIVQIYGQAPYKAGGIEKSAIQLLAFDKTEELEPGASQTLTISVDLQNIASYDNTVNNSDGTKGTYILDEGKYYFATGNGAHDALNNILAKQGKTGMDTNGTAANAFEWNYDYQGSGTVDTTTFSITKNNEPVSNQLNYADWNSFEGASKVTYLSRNNWSGTYPTTYSNLTAPASMLPLLNGNYYEIKTTDDTSAIKFGDTSVEFTLADMKLSEYNDPRWDALMNKITLVDAMGTVAANGNKFRNLDSVGFPMGSYTENSGNGVALSLFQTITPDAPWTIATATDKSDPNSEFKLEVLACAPTVAASFDPKLMNEAGQMVGLEALFVGLPILWGPGLNTHRDSYNGRNGDYYSEDAILSGNAAMEFSNGAIGYGLVAAPKHFAFNDQETNRNAIAPFMTEQRAREVELRAFQIAFESTKYDILLKKNVGMLGVMTSFSKIGPVECTSSYGLLTGILQKEWGFTGYAVTDISDDFDLFTAVAYSGATGYDVRMGYVDTGFDKYQSMADKIVPTPELYAKDATMLNAFKTAAHRTLWTFTQSNFMNGYNSSSHTESQMTWWREAYIGGIGVLGILMLGFVAMYILSTKKSKKDGITL